MELLSKQNKNFSETSFCHDFREFLENSKILRPFSKHFEKKHKFEMKKNWQWAPLKQTFFVQNRLKVGWAPYRSHEITCIFSKYKKSLKAKTLEENIVILWWKLLFRRDVCLFESSFLRILEPIWTRIPSNPLFFDHFGVQLTYFLNLLESSPGAQYQHFHSKTKFSCFENQFYRGSM